MDTIEESLVGQLDLTKSNKTHLIFIYVSQTNANRIRLVVF